MAESLALTAVAGLVVISAWVWATGQVADYLATGQWARVPAAATVSVLDRLPHHLSDPGAAWPKPMAPSLPSAPVIYGVAMVLLVPVALALLLLQRRGGGHGRRWHRPGSHWARRRDLRPLRVLTPGRKGRLVVGRAKGGSRLATEARHSVLVIGPTQSGKTTGLAVPAILEWNGPVIATSVKDDLASVTLGWRSTRGPCWVFDPTVSSGLPEPARWSPLDACGDWSAAQRVAAWLVDATPGRDGMADAAFWYTSAAKQLAPLLLAAERGGGGMEAVVRWTNSSEFGEPLQLLELSGEPDAACSLAACAGRDERIRSSISTTLETVLAPFEDPFVSRFTAASDISLPRLLEEGGTLYLCGPGNEQQRVQALFAALVSAAVSEAVRRVNASGRPLRPPLLIVLDEAANIAPVRDLDSLASTAAGIGIQLVTVCQDLAQLSARYGQDRARTIANNHRAKLLLSGVSDLSTLDLVSGLAGETAVREHSVSYDLRNGGRTRSSTTAIRRLAPSDQLRRIPPGEGVLVYGHLPPVHLRLRPWFADRRLRRKAKDRAAGTSTLRRAGT